MPRIVTKPSSLNPDQRRMYDLVCEDYVKDIKKEYGALLSQNDIAEYFGLTRDTAAKYIQDIPYTLIGKRKKWHAIDIARYMAEKRAYR